MESTTPLDTLGPTRQDPRLDSAALSARTPLAGTHTTSQELAPAQVSAFSAQGTGTTIQPHSLAEEVGPPSSVVGSRDISRIASQTPHIHASIETSSLFSSHDSQEVITNTAGTTLVPDVVVARTSTSSFHTPTLSHFTQQSEHVAEQQEWFPREDSISMPDLSPYEADLELSPTVMASLSETVLVNLLSQTAIPLRDSSHILALRQRASPLPPSILQSVAPSPIELHSATVCATSKSFPYSTSLLGSSSKENHSSDSVSVKSDEGNASFVSDSTVLGDTDVEPPYEQHQIWLPKSTEALDAYSVHTDKTGPTDYCFFTGATSFQSMSTRSRTTHNPTA